MFLSRFCGPFLGKNNTRDGKLITAKLSRTKHEILSKHGMDWFVCFAKVTIGGCGDELSSYPAGRVESNFPRTRMSIRKGKELSMSWFGDFTEKYKLYIKQLRWKKKMTTGEHSLIGKHSASLKGLLIHFRLNSAR